MEVLKVAICRHCHKRLSTEEGGLHACTPVHLELQGGKVDHWATSLADFLRAPKAARYPRPEDFAQTRFGPL